MRLGMKTKCLVMSVTAVCGLGIVQLLAASLPSGREARSAKSQSIIQTSANRFGVSWKLPYSEENQIPARGPNRGETVNPKHPLPPYRKSVGGQEAALTVDWVTPESIVVGEQGKFDLVIRNRGRIAIEQISIKNVLPASFQLVRADQQQPPAVLDR